jgi:hypothetical protein
MSDRSINHIALRLDTRMISFETYDFGTYALLTDRHAHMPFQSWRIRPKAVDHVVFTLNTQSFEITLEVRVSVARERERDDLSWKYFSI